MARFKIHLLKKNLSFFLGLQADKSALQAFLDSVTTSESQDQVSFVEFEDFYEGLSLCIDQDEDFANILHNTWNI